MEQINKQIIKPRFTNKQYILLGRRKDDNQKVYIEQASFDCSWYYGFGYLEVLNANKTDISEHYHFKSFFNGKKNAYDEFKEMMISCVLPDKQIWELIDLMKSFYSLKSVYELYHSGSSHYTTVKEPNLKNEDKAQLILKDQKIIILAVMKLLSGQDMPIINDKREV